MSQGFNQLNMFNKNLPAKVPGISYSEIPEPFTRRFFDVSDSKQLAYKLPNGTYTSNQELANIAKQQVAKANRKALLRTAGKGVGIVPMAAQFYKDIAFPVANDLYQGFIMGNPDKSKTLQVALSLAGIDRNGNRIPRKPNNTSTNNSNNTGNPTDANGRKGNSSIGGQSTAQAQALALAQRLGGNPPVVNQQEADTQQSNINAINDYVSKLQEINQPYIESLQRFADNYGDLYNKNQLYNRRMRDLSAITGSPLWYQSAKDYNPIEVEATKIDLQKKIQDAQYGDINAINEVMGNMAIAKELDLPYEAAFANKNLLTALTANRRNLTDWEKAQLAAELKRYGIDVGYNKAMAQQALRNKGALDVALTNAAAFGGGVAPGLNMAGGIATPQELTMAQVLNKAQQQNR